jgi:hypothetical protein
MQAKNPTRRSPLLLLQSGLLTGDKDHAKIAGLTIAWAQTLRAAWLMMTQPGVTTFEDLRPAVSITGGLRPYEPPLAVRVVHIRRREDAPARAEGPRDREYQVRWIVRGHWRNQWYPARQDHRPVWINPHLKGSAGAPLQTGESVHVLDRPVMSTDEG